LNTVDTAARRDYEILAAIADGRHLTQRALAQRLGIALGLANLYLRRLARKGYIKVTTIPPRRVRYRLTPPGLAEKVRLTSEYMRHSVVLYRQARRTWRESLGPLPRDGARRVALYGTGEAAELAYLALRELGLEPVLVLDGHGGGTFLGHHVRGVSEVAPADCDRIVIATLEDAGRIVTRLRQRGFRRDGLVTLRR
jgi:DNA-binding MarR family transcriptional regulator